MVMIGIGHEGEERTFFSFLSSCFFSSFSAFSGGNGDAMVPCDGMSSRGCKGKQQWRFVMDTFTAVQREGEESGEEEVRTAAAPPVVVEARSSKRLYKREAKPVRAYCRRRSNTMRSTTNALGEI